jgi:YfiH family protein
MRALEIEGDQVFMVRQAHGDRVYILDDPARTAAQTARVEADAIVTALRGKPVGVLTADCVPVIVYDARRHVVGVVHAGRRGAAENIVAKTLRILKRRFGGRPEDFMVGMGPAIGACCYEVDESCLPPFKNNRPRWEQLVVKASEGKYMLDLFLANAEDALSEGVPRENIFRSGNCTACENHRFFSYRKEGNAGRLLSLAMLR